MNKLKTCNVFVKITTTYASKNKLTSALLEKIKEVDSVMFFKAENAIKSIANTVNFCEDNCDSNCKSIKPDIWEDEDGIVHVHLGVVLLEIYPVYYAPEIFAEPIANDHNDD